MTLGEKIKRLRIQQGFTQSDLCGDKITRNMLSAIENDKATPSLSTIQYLSDKLGVPLAFIFSEDENLFTFEKHRGIKNIKQAYSEKRFSDVVSLCSALSNFDDELCLMLANAYFELGKKALFMGALLTAENYFLSAIKNCDATIYDTDNVRKNIPLYSALVKNIQSPLLELDRKQFEKTLEPSDDFELYKYISLDRSFDYRNKLYADHLAAKELIKRRDYFSAIKMLSQLEAQKSLDNYNAFAFFAIYTDLEICYKQVGDFEKAYRYSNKRISLLEGFKT